MTSGRTKPLEAAEQLELVAREIRKGSRSLDPELADALRHEMERHPELRSSDVPDWQWALVEEALADGDDNDDVLEFRERLAQMRRRPTG